MEEHPPASEDLSVRCQRPEPIMPPGLNREEAWAWAMDNFPALCRRSCASRPAIGERSRGAHGLLRGAGAWPMDVSGGERGQKPCGDPRVLDSQPPQADASARSEGHTHASGAPLAPGHLKHPRKRLKTQA